MAKKLGTLIKEARTEAGFTQEQLARKISGLSASDISAAERNKMVPTQAQLKAIAKATGVTQASLINAARGSSSTSGSGKKKSSSGKSSIKVTASEKKLVELYRAADSDTRKAAVSLLKGEQTSAEDIISNLLGNAIEMFGAKE